MRPGGSLRVVLGERRRCRNCPCILSKRGAPRAGALRSACWGQRGSRHCQAPALEDPPHTARRRKSVSTRKLLVFSRKRDLVKEENSLCETDPPLGPLKSLARRVGPWRGSRRARLAHRSGGLPVAAGEEAHQMRENRDNLSKHQVSV